MPIDIENVVVPDADDIDDSTTTNKFTTAAEISKLAGIESGATADQSDAEIETAYNNQVSIVSQAEAEAGVATTRRGWTALRVAQAIAALGGGAGSKATDSLTSGSVTAVLKRFGGSATTISNPGAGEYDLDIKSGADIERIRVHGDNGDLNGSNEFILTIDNSANSEDRTFSVQIYQTNTGALVDQQATATVHTQTTSGNVTTLTFPGMNGFGATGFDIELR